MLYSVQGEIFHTLLPTLRISSQSSSFFGDTTVVPKAPQKKVQCEIGRGLGRTKASPRGTHLLVREIIPLVKCHFYQVTRDPTILPLWKETKAQQLVLVYTMILQLEVKFLMYLVSLFIGLYILCRRYNYFVHCLTLSSIMV